MHVIVDTDFMSSFLKIGRLELVKEFFGEENIYPGCSSVWNCEIPIQIIIHHSLHNLAIAGPDHPIHNLHTWARCATIWVVCHSLPILASGIAQESVLRMYRSDTKVL
jgi:hypothetical protein